MQAIDTFYKGYRFRSRLEARWAVVFDALGIDWVYEPEGYKLDNGECYLPDFYIPSANAYIEIKGQEPTDDEIKKSVSLSSQFGETLEVMATGDARLISFLLGELYDFCLKDEQESNQEKLAYITIRSAIESVKGQRKSYLFYGGLESNSILCMKGVESETTLIEGSVYNSLFYLLSTKNGMETTLWSCHSNRVEAKKIISMTFDKIKKSIAKGKIARFEHGERP